MYEFGEELIIESNKLPWLIWIQLLITILIIMLLFHGFTIFSSDVSNQSSINNASSSTSHHVNNSRPNNINASSSNTRVEQTEIKGNAGASSSTDITAELVQEREGSSSKNSISFRPFQVSEHPCHYLGLAKQAFLKCLGLDLSERASDKQQHLKND